MTLTAHNSNAETAVAPRPLTAAALGLAAGIALAHIFYSAPTWWPLPLALAAATLLIGLRLISARALLLGALAVIFVIAGIPLYRLSARDVPEVYAGACMLVGTVDAVWLSADGIDYTVKDAKIITPDGAVSLEGKARVVGASLQTAAMPGQQLALADARVRRPDGPRNPGGFNARLYSMTKGYSYIAYSRGEAQDSGKGGRLSSALVSARMEILGAIDELWPHREENAIVRGLLLGDTSALSPDEREAFSMLGISHVLAVSGLHLGFVMLFLEGVIKLIFLPLPRKYAWLYGRMRLPRAVVVFLGLIGYAALTGFSPSTVRALIMAGVFLYAKALVVRPDGATALSAAVLIILLLRPMDLFSASFQMSVGAVAGILLLNTGFERALTRWIPRRFASSLSVSMSAQLGILPLLARNYNRVPLLGLLANLFAVPLSGAIVMAGIPVVALHFIAPAAAKIAAYPVALCGRLLSRLALACAQYPLMSAEIASPSFAMMALFWIALLLLSPAGRALGRGLRRFSLAACAGVSVAAVVMWALTLFPVDPVVTILDAGQGLSAMVRHKSAAILIDSGDSLAALDAARYYGLSYDAAFLTHEDRDHAGTMGEMIWQGRVERLYLPVGIDTDSEYTRLALDAAKEQSVPVEFVSEGDVFRVGELVFAVHAPLPGRYGQGENANMLVLSAGREGELGALFTGDLSMWDERGIGFPRARVLQIAHHGSDQSTSAAFLDVVQPEAAVIPVGKYNTYGHPGAQLLERLAQSGAIIERTDMSGAVEITMGEELRITRWGGER